MISSSRTEGAVSDFTVQVIQGSTEIIVNNNFLPLYASKWNFLSPAEQALVSA